MVISPTRPTNISTTITNLLLSCKSGVKFRLDPTVLNAETASKVSDNNGKL